MENSNAAPASPGLTVASSPLRLLREESMDANGTLSPISSRSNGTDTETDTKKKVRLYFTFFVFLICLLNGLKIGCTNRGILDMINLSRFFDIIEPTTSWDTVTLKTQ